MSSNPERRLQDFATVLPVELRVISSIPTTRMGWLESYLHVAFRHRRTRGEWFRLSDEEISLIRVIPAIDTESDLPPAVMALYHQNSAPPPRQQESMTEEQLVAVIAANVLRVRTGAGLTQADLEKRTGIAVPHLSRLESGKHVPSLKTLNCIADALGVNLCDLVTAPTPEPKGRRGHPKKGGQS